MQKSSRMLKQVKKKGADEGTPENKYATFLFVPWTHQAPPKARPVKVTIIRQMRIVLFC